MVVSRVRWAHEAQQPGAGRGVHELVNPWERKAIFGAGLIHAAKSTHIRHLPLSFHQRRRWTATPVIDFSDKSPRARASSLLPDGDQLLDGVVPPLTGRVFGSAKAYQVDYDFGRYPRHVTSPMQTHQVGP
ncbi:hypothetical protein Nepgr_017679 [Nepenthes gracilis]|uniref:Uncharacterized protein n=1 Tax=Nepenthes gracilis TaxID=150966 RepID=A0AAD3XSP9_NEPGR|nr:hypothetical protein Nepgr_017679 [Nepenthes gracilis]